MNSIRSRTLNTRLAAVKMLHTGAGEREQFMTEARAIGSRDDYERSVARFR